MTHLMVSWGLWLTCRRRMSSLKRTSMSELPKWIVNSGQWTSSWRIWIRRGIGSIIWSRLWPVKMSSLRLRLMTWGSSCLKNRRSLRRISYPVFRHSCLRSLLSIPKWSKSNRKQTNALPKWSYPNRGLEICKTILQLLNKSYLGCKVELI